MGIKVKLKGGTMVRSDGGRLPYSNRNSRPKQNEERKGQRAIGGEGGGVEPQAGTQS